MKQKATKKLSRIKIHPQDLNHEQPLARFMISLFNLFENDLMASLSKENIIDVTRSDFNVLRYVDPSGSTVSQLAQYAGVSKQAISKQVDSLIRRGYLRKMSDAIDGRQVNIVFTRKGETLIGSSINIIAKIEARFERKLGSTAYRRLKSDLSSLMGLYSKID
ncbi:MAG: MarR family transcriptional regulator [Proteobacteria bacterium]|nr:MarR family transcriptional regulator [Pseudomonadota bacterium]